MSTILLCEIDPYAGPLDLLLYLVKERKIEVEEVSLASIAQQFIDFMENGRESLETLSAYMVVAATLIQIKARMLGPNAPDQEDDIPEAADLRSQMQIRLARQLAFSQIAEYFDEKPQLHRDFFVRGIDESAEYGTTVRVVEPRVFDLVEAYRSTLDRLRQRVPPVVQQNIRSVRQQIQKLRSALLSMFAQGECTLADVDEAVGQAPEQRLVTFLAFLQLVKRNLVIAKQEQVLGPIQLAPSDSWNSEALAQSLDATATTDL